MAENRPKNASGTEYTVNKQAKIAKLEKRSTDVQESSLTLSCVKCAVAGFMAISLLLLLVASKVSLVSIAQRINLSNKTKNFPKHSVIACGGKYVEETAFIMLVLIMMVPQFFCFLSAVSNSAFCSSEPWPSKQAALWVRICFFGGTKYATKRQPSGQICIYRPSKSRLENI